MEVFPCSGIQYAMESDCPQRGSGTALVYQEEPNCPENGEQTKLADGQLNESLHNMQAPEIERQGEGTQTVCDLLTNSDCQCNGASCCDCQVVDQKEYYGFHDFEEDVINERYLTSENSPSIVDTIEIESPNIGREGDLSFSEPKWLEGDGSLALWVKWRGKWQAGIRCARADWPLSTLRAKPTHDRKKYFVIFFPHTRIYSWADMLLVRSINEFPHPIAYKTHQARKLEAQLDKQMISYRKLVSAKVSTKADTAESGLESWIERLLNQLKQVNSQMQAWVSSGGSEMVSHTLTRHQEIFQDLTQVFYSMNLSYPLSFCVSILLSGSYGFIVFCEICMRTMLPNVRGSFWTIERDLKLIY